MRIKLTKEEQEKLHSVGLVNVGKQVEVEEPVFKKNYAEWKKTLPLAGHSTLALKAISTCLWTKRSGEHRKDFVLPQPKQEVKVQAKFPRWELRIIIGLLVLILGWLVFALPAKAQFSQIVFIEWKDGGSAVNNGFFTFPFAIDCTTNVTCTSDGSTLTISASAGSGGRWDQLTAPTGAMSLVSNADAEIMTWDFQSNFSTDRFVLKQTTGNPTGGALLLVSATDADALLAQFGASNGVQITQAGVLSAIGSGGIIATTGDSATSFFSSGTLEDARLSTNVALYDNGTQTWGSGSSFNWTFNAGAVDPVWEFTSGNVNLSTGTLQQGGDDVIHKGTNTLLSTENLILDGSANPRDITLGIIRILQTPNIDSTRGIAIITDAAGFGDTKSIEVDWTATGVAAGDFEAVIDVDIDTANSSGGNIIALEITQTTTGSATTYGMLTGIGINPILNEAGSFGNIETAFTFNSGFTDVTAAFNSTGTDVQMFAANGDLVYIGMAALFDEVEFILAVVATNAGIKPTFEYSDGASGWITFSPTDNTNGMRQNGDLVWIASALAGWAQGTVNSVSSKFWIRITRTAVTVSTPPTEDLVQVNSDVDYVWDSGGNLNVASVSSGFNAEIADAGFIRCENNQACMAWELATPGTDKTLIVDSSDILQFNGTFNATTLTQGGTAVAPSDATYITQTSDAGLSAEQALDALASGIMRVDTAAGVITSLTNSAGIIANIDDETGTGVLVFGTTPTIATPVVTGKSDRNNVAVNDDDCTGEQGNWWYDTDDSAFEFCNANSGTPTVLGNASFTASSSDTLTNKTYDVEGTGNVFTSVFHIEWQAGTCIGASASSNFDDSPTLTEPAAACVAGSVITSARLDFDKDTDEGMQISFVLPTGFTGTADFDFYWHGTPTSNDVVWALETVCVADAETLDPAFNAAQTVTDTAKGTANQLNIATISTVTLTGCAAEERMFLQISRDANAVGDDFDADARLVSTRFTGRRTQ